MNDFEYDCLQRKQLARQASHKKSGRKSKRCSLSSDHLTTKQWKERNGAIMSICLNKRMSWEEFIQLNTSMAEEYIKHLQSKFGANAKLISEMFEVGIVRFRNHLNKIGANVDFPHSPRMSRTQLAEWDAFLNPPDTAVATVDVASSIPDVTISRSPAFSTSAFDTSEKSSSSLQTKSCMRMDNFSLNFSGSLDVDGIANSLRRILGDNSIGQIEIKCTLVN